MHTKGLDDDRQGICCVYMYMYLYTIIYLSIFICMHIVRPRTRELPLLCVLLG